MSAPFGLRLIDDDELEGAPASSPVHEAPQVFVRTLSTPPGVPWDQSRAADLEARLGAPLPLSEVVYQLRRLEGWRPGAAARWAVFYARAQDIGDRLQASPTVEGQILGVEFFSSSERRRRTRCLAVVTSAAAVLVALCVASMGAAFTARGDAAAELDAAEQIATSRLGQAKALKQSRDDARRLDEMGLRGRALSDVLADFAWAGSAKAPDMRIGAVHWDRGLMTVEVRGDGAPFVRLDRPVRKADKPASGGVTVWTVAPSNDSGGVRATGARPVGVNQ